MTLNNSGNRNIYDIFVAEIVSLGDRSLSHKQP
jgi:hypothetical protein